MGVTDIAVAFYVVEEERVRSTNSNIQACGNVSLASGGRDGNGVADSDGSPLLYLDTETTEGHFEERAFCIDDFPRTFRHRSHQGNFFSWCIDAPS